MISLAAACAALAPAEADAARVMPWLAPYRPIGRAVAMGVLAGRSVAQALNAAAAATTPAPAPADVPPCFVPQAELPDGEAYESFVARTGCVPTRDHLHDLLNGLVWLRYGALKHRLNRLQAQQIACDGVGRTRGPVRDALTLFDENAALLQAPQALLDALRRRDWQRAFVQCRAAWRDARLGLFGHALLEKLFEPRKPITAHVWLLPPAEGKRDVAEGDGADGRAAPAQLLGEAIARALTSESLCRRPGLVLPVLGVPGWWPANEDGNFYVDAAVFRPAPAGCRTSVSLIGRGL